MPSSSIQRSFNDWQASCDLLKDSLGRYVPYTCLKKYTSQELEFYDSLSFRYTKALETAFYFFRSLELELNGKSGEFLRDQLLEMEKLNIIDSTDEWMQARQLRNKITHAYEPEELEEIFKNVIFHARKILGALPHAQEHVRKL